MKNHIRNDGSVHHILNYDLHTGECLGPVRGQGTGTDSAWAIYGYVLSFIHTGKQECLDVSKRVANYFIACTSRTGYISPYDLR